MAERALDFPNVASVKAEDAALVASILAVLEQIDAMRSPPKRCKSCRFRDGRESDYPGGIANFPRCVKGHKPIAVDDGCDDWEQRNWALPLCDND